MSYYMDWSLAIIQPLMQELVIFTVRLLLAIVVFVIGYLISAGIGKLITEILKSIRFNRLFEREGWKQALQRASIEVNPSEFIGSIFKWVFVIVSLLIAVDILRLAAFAGFLSMVLDYVPRVVVAVLVFVVAVIIADIVEKVVRASVERLKVGYGYVVSSIVKWAIWIFVLFLVLDQLLPTSDLIRTLYTAIVYGIVGSLTLGIGLAIGLGGKEVAARMIEDMHKRIKE